MNNRNNWTFKYTSEALLTACDTKERHHNERLELWTDKKDELMATIKSSGLEFSDNNQLSLNSSMAITNTPHLTVNAELQSQLKKAIAKINEHRERANSYNKWKQIFTANPYYTLDLTQDDWLFFFGK